MSRQTPRLDGELGEILVFLAQTQFSSATDLAILMMMPTRAVSGHLAHLRTLRMVDCRTRATQSLKWARLYWVSTRGLRAAVSQGLMTEGEARRSASITQTLSGRVDAAVLITRVATDLASAIDSGGEIIHAPVRHPADALIRVGTGWAAVFRQGYAQARAMLQERIARYDGRPAFALVVTPTVTDRIAIHRHLQRADQTEACVVAETLVGVKPDVFEPWIHVATHKFLELDEVAKLLPTCDRPDLPSVRGRSSPLRSIAQGFRYGSGVTRLLNALLDWYLVRMEDLADILQVQPDTLYKDVLAAGDLVESRRGHLRRDGDEARLCLSPKGIEHVALRDLVRPTALLADLSVERDGGSSTRSYTGSRIRQWARQSIHDDYVADTTGEIVWSLGDKWLVYDVIPSPRSEMAIWPGATRRAWVAELFVFQWRRHTSKRPKRKLTENTVITFRPDAVIMLGGRVRQGGAHPSRGRAARADTGRARAASGDIPYPLASRTQRRAGGSFAGLWVFDDWAAESTAWQLIESWRRRSGRLSFIATSTTSLIEEHGVLERVWRSQGMYHSYQTLDEAIVSLDPLWTLPGDERRPLAVSRCAPNVPGAVSMLDTYLTSDLFAGKPEW